mgnify:CR=1 FL=1
MNISYDSSSVHCLVWKWYWDACAIWRQYFSGGNLIDWLDSVLRRMGNFFQPYNGSGVGSVMVWDEISYLVGLLNKLWMKFYAIGTIWQPPYNKDSKITSLFSKTTKATCFMYIQELFVQKDVNVFATYQISTMPFIINYFSSISKPIRHQWGDILQKARMQMVITRINNFEIQVRHRLLEFCVCWNWNYTVLIWINYEML